MPIKGVPVAQTVSPGSPLGARATSRPMDQRPSLSADDLMARALEQQGRTGFHNRVFVEPLRRLVDSLNGEARLNAFGRRAARFDAARCLTNLLRLDAAEESCPEIASWPIERPIFVTGLPRSGTTFLHAILARDSANAVPRCWQLIYPYPKSGRSSVGDWRKTRVALQLGIYRLVAPRVAELHPMAADGPQECSDITAQIFHSLRFDSMYHVPSYQDWIARHDHVNAYNFHKRFLRHLDHQEPGRRWILKSPDHVFALDAIRRVYPDALFVFLHRDPMPVLASQLNLTEALRRSFASHIDLKEIGRSVAEAIVDTANRLVENRDAPGVLHLSFRSLIAAPLEAVRRIYAHSGLFLSPKTSEQMKRWVWRQKPSCARAHRSELAEFGLDVRDIYARFERYVQTFEVAREKTLTARGA